MIISIQNVSDLVVCFGGVLLLCMKVAAMQRYHQLRVFFLSVILSCFLIYLFCALVEPTPFDHCTSFGNQY